MIKDISKTILLALLCCMGAVLYTIPPEEPIAPPAAPTPEIKIEKEIEPKEEIIEDEEYIFFMDEELNMITNISQKLTSSFGSDYLGCNFSSGKYVIFKLTTELENYYHNYKSIEQELNEISKYGHSHLPSNRNCIIMIEYGEKCLFISENGRGVRY